MAASGKLSRKQEVAVAALLTSATLEEAATKVGVALRTLKNWLTEPAVKEALRQARTEILERTVNGLLQLTGDAIGTLKRNLTCGNPSAEIRAAAAVLDYASRGVELTDLVGQVEELRREVEGARGDEPGDAQNAGGETPGAGGEPPGDEPGFGPAAERPQRDLRGDDAGRVANGTAPLAGAADAAAVLPSER
jgi:hypothetical protein